MPMILVTRLRLNSAERCFAEVVTNRLMTEEPLAKIEVFYEG